MRLSNLSFRGLSKRFTGETPVSINFESFGPGLVALRGRNGAGKTTTLEATAICLYQRMPSRPGSIYDWIRRADAFVETSYLDAERGDRYVAKLLIDPSKKHTEGYLTLNGEKQVSGKVTEFNARVRDIFGSYDLFLAAPFAAQNKAGNFLYLKKAERKELFTELLGISYLQETSDRAKVKREAVEKTLEAFDVQIRSILAALASMDEVVKQLGIAQAQAQGAEVVLVDLQRAEEEARIALTAAEGAEAELARLSQRVESLAALSRTAEAAYQTAVQEQTKAGSRFQLAVAQARQALEELTEGPLNSRLEREARSFDERARSLNALIAQEEEVRAAGISATAKTEELAGLRQQQEARRSLEGELTQARHALSLAEQALKQAEGSRMDALLSLDERVRLLSKVPCTSSEEWFNAPTDAVAAENLAGTCPLLANAHAAKLEADSIRATTLELWQGNVRAAQGVVDRLQTAVEEAPHVLPAQLETLGREIDKLKSRALMLPQIEQAHAGLRSLGEERATAEAAGARERENLLSARARAEERLQQTEADSNSTLVELNNKVSAAASAKNEALLNHSDATQELQDARSKLADEPTARLALTQAKERTAAQGRRISEYQQAVGSWSARRESLLQSEAQLAQVREEAAGAQAEHADWKIIEQAFSKDGLQALEIAEAGPEVGAITNELLSACPFPDGPLTVKLETLRPKKTAAGEFSEAFDIKVFDGSGEERLAEWLCGGEKTIVGEALGNGIAVYNKRKNGMQWETLFRDEVAGALDEEGMADAYILMLRKTLEVGGFHQVISIMHQHELYQSCDVQLHVHDGMVEVVNNHAREEAASA
jgi:DNA repair exonuclease SbcCD ATPase subunit